MSSKPVDRPRYRFSADRHSARRRVHYVESNHPNDGQCTLCQLDELAQQPLLVSSQPALTDIRHAP